MKPAVKSRWRRWLGPAAFAALFAIALAAASLIPPIQSPDEQSHLTRAYMISNGQLLLTTPRGASSGGMVDSAFISFFDAYMSTIAVDAKARLSPAQKSRIELLRWGGPQRFYQIPGTGYYMPLVYAPHALGLWLGRTLDLSVANSYQLVRVVCLLSCLGLLAWAFRLMRPPVLAAALLLLPMTVFQLLAPTLDGVTTCLAVLALSLFLRQLLVKEDSPAARTWVLAASVALLASSRVQLLPLLALPFYLAWARGSRRDALAGVAALLASAGWTAYALAHTVDTRVKLAYSTGQLLLHYAANPGAFFTIVSNSVTDSERWEAYWKSFIGILGWLNVWLPAWSYEMLWIGLALCAAVSVLAARPREALLARLGLVVAALACVALVFLAMLVTWTPHPAVAIRGVQGRYFIVPALMIAYALGATPAPRGPRWPAWGVLCATAAVSLYALMTTVLERYH